MRIFVYEHLTGGGRLSAPERPDEMASLAAEGQSMVAALAEDLAAIGGVELASLRDRRVKHSPLVPRCVEVATSDEHDAAFDELATEADWTVVIAPEIGGALAKRCRRVVDVGGRLLGGSLEMLLLASDKHATAQHLAAAGVPVPYGVPHLLGQPWPDDFPYPAVWKPLDGAGSAGLRLIEDCKVALPSQAMRPGRLEELCPKRAAAGPFVTNPAIAASVAFLCGPAAQLGLPPCRQHLTDDLRYLGGSLLLEPHLAERASRLALRAVEALPGPFGFVGVDLVLSGRDETDDVVIEINPRLTTSYIGLRAACRENLAAALLAVAADQPVSLSFRDAVMEWEANGRVQARAAQSFSASA